LRLVKGVPKGILIWMILFSSSIVPISSEEVKKSLSDFKNPKYSIALLLLSSLVVI